MYYLCYDRYGNNKKKINIYFWYKFYHVKFSIILNIKTIFSLIEK